MGTWNSWNGLDIKDIVWPGGSHVPPQGVPEKFHIRITFLEEPPFIIISDPDPISKKCSMNRGVPCYMREKSGFLFFCCFLMPSLLRWISFVRRTLDSNQTQTKCCSGLCIDLLTKFEDELGFTYDLVRVSDPKWGTFEVSFLNSKLSFFQNWLLWPLLSMAFGMALCGNWSTKEPTWCCQP